MYFLIEKSRFGINIPTSLESKERTYPIEEQEIAIEKAPRHRGARSESEIELLMIPWNLRSPQFSSFLSFCLLEKYRYSPLHDHHISHSWFSVIYRYDVATGRSYLYHRWERFWKDTYPRSNPSREWVITPVYPSAST